MDAMYKSSDEMQKAIHLGKLIYYLMDHPALLYRSKRFRTVALQQAVKAYAFAGVQKQEIVAAANEEGAVMDSSRYDTASELQDIMWNFVSLSVFN
jgi:hypothetical protein